MTLHQALLRGNGSYDVLVRSPNEIDELAETLTKTNLGADMDLADTGNLLLPKRPVLPADRPRFVKHMSERPLELGCITVGPGFGKTTALAVGTLAMAATLG
ncbi:hypothetical protein GGI35DRAFT_476142 [Trichoderma velutinum]